MEILTRDCVWARELQWTVEEGDAIVDCCPDVARQMLKHNEKHGEFCD